PGALPLLQFTLTELFDRRQNATVTTEAYEDLGGIGGALARRAEDLYEATAIEQRGDVHRLFTELVTPGDDSDDLRRRATVEELADIAPRVIEEYRSNRLIVTDHHPVTREPTVEVAHEALLREWPRLAGWIDGDRDTIRVRRSLTVAAHDWQSDPADESTLYRGTRLVAADQVAQTLTLTGGERDFLAASHELADRERVARERANRRLRLLLVAALITLVLASATGVVALRQRDRASDQAARANDQAARAEAASVSAEVDRIVAEVPRLLDRDRSLAALLAAEAVRLRPTPAARGALLSTLTNEPRLRFTLNGGRSGYFRATGFPDGRRVAALGRDGVDVWDIEARRLLGRFDVEDASAIAVSHDGALITVGSADGTVTFWDGERFEQVGDPVAFDEPVTGLSFSPDDRTLAVSFGRFGVMAAATTRTTPQLVDVATRRLTGTSLGGHRTTVNAIAFSPDGRVIATGGNDGRIVLHDAATGQTLGSPIQLFAGVNSLAFSSDGRLVAAGSVDSGPGGRAAGVFDVATHRQVDAGINGSVGFTTVEFTADGSQLLVSSGLRVWAWDASTWAEVGEPIETHHGPGHVISLPDHPILVSGTDGTLTSWDLDALPLVSRLVPGSPSAGGFFSPDGATLVTVDNADQVFLYRADDLTPLATLSVDGPGARRHLIGATPVAFSPDGHTLAVGDRRGRVRLFDTEAGRALGPPITIYSVPIVSLGFSPDGRLLVVMSNVTPANGAHVVDIAARSVQALEPAVPFALGPAFTPDGSELVLTSLSGAQAFRFPVSDGEVGVGSPIDALQGTVASASYSPDGSRLAVGTANGTLEFLDAETLEPVGAPISVSPTLIAGTAFSADGSLAIVVDLDGSQRLVDVRDGTPLGEAISGNGVGLGLSGFAPDGSVVVLPDPAGSVLLDLDGGHWRDAACELAGRQLTRAEWDQYLPSAGGYEPSC
ncbi:MAG: WD40 repeat domain-containing protein, partial [Acidimicrobiales bacterium]